MPSYNLKLGSLRSGLVIKFFYNLATKEVTKKGFCFLVQHLPSFSFWLTYKFSAGELLTLIPCGLYVSLYRHVSVTVEHFFIPYLIYHFTTIIASYFSSALLNMLSCRIPFLTPFPICFSLLRTSCTHRSCF